MTTETQRLINTARFDDSCRNLAMGNNIHRGFSRQEIIDSLNNPGEFTNGIKAEVKEWNGRIEVKVWYTDEYYVSAC